ncbi:MAG TPA: penicillin acylase family protein [Dehalococcoidia bacterium]|nr:penicillin acylase family protein [Dehalococcoidia bacterium]
MSVRRDRHGVPYIDAHNDDDAWFALGFCQAQDRAFQLDLRLRTVRGTLCEMFGVWTLSIDRLSRRVGFIESSRRQLPMLDADVRRQIEAFVRGINAGLATTPRAPEHALLRSKASPWEPVDVLAMGKLLSFLLVGNGDVELSRLKVLQLDGPQALRDLDPTPYPEEHVVVSPPGTRAGAAIDRLGEDIQRFVEFTGRGGGSNAWAIAGSRTKSGRPILANDPHLEGTLPPHWYLAHIRAPGWEVAGASLIGAPGIGSGHNGFAAWGVTAGFMDTVDLFVEDVTPDGRGVRRGDEIEKCDLRREVIKIRGKRPVVEEVLVTPRGPIIGPVLQGDAGAISLRAMWLDAKPARGFLTAHRARSFEAFRQEFRHWPLLSQNVAYADADGTIGWQLVGEAPLRREGWGSLPLHAADPATGWLDEGVPFDAMPFACNPDGGFIATANNKPVPDSAGAPFLGVDWLDGYRAGRITEALSQRSDWDVAATQGLQLDQVSLAWQEVRDIIIGLDAIKSIKPAMALLRHWDGRVAAGSPAAAIFEAFVREMARRIAHARAPRSAEWALGRGFNDLLTASTFAAGRQSRVLRRLREQPDGWFEHGWRAEMVKAMRAVVRDLSARFGADESLWAWGRVRPITLSHPLGVVKPLAMVLNRGPFPWGGDGNTVSQASGTETGVIASLRVVIPMDDWEAARFVMPGGQSGNPFSPHYDDQLELWKHGEGIPIAWSEDAIARATVSTLRLMPLPMTRAGGGPDGSTTARS